ncbi:MFS transporter [Brevibacillus panacihumi]|uniref:MFS transporter n=1 Tax=Brevibacillus panacihumi TaxID=497735 RepID=A0A3M8D684_9BACL|nr:MFS transporter [Brevibacillus panacihumi]RNB82927.1 MFS transporter [Brevibacillus panacihumi]
MEHLEGKRHGKFMILFVLIISYAMAFADRSILNFSLSYIGEDLHLSATALGVILSSFSLGYTLMQIPGGWLSDRFGSKIVALVSIIVWSLFTVTSGLAWSMVSLIIIRFLFGIGEGGFPSATSKLVAETFPTNQRARAQSAMLSCVALGGALGPIVAAPIILSYGWRPLFFMMGGVGLVVAILFYLFIPKRKVAVQEQSNTSQPKIPLKVFLKMPTVWKLVIAWLGLELALYGFAWVPIYLIKVRKIELIQAGLFSALPNLAATVAMVISGFLLDKYFKQREKHFLVGSMLLGAGFLYAITITSDVYLTIAFLVLSTVFLRSAITAVWAIPLKVLPSEVVGSISGILNFGGQAAGFLSPMIMGVLISANNDSYDTGWLFLGACLVVAAIVASTIGKGKKDIEEFHLQTNHE